MWKTAGSEELRTGSAGRNRGARARQVSWVARWCEFDSARHENGLHRLVTGGYGERWLVREVATAWSAG